METYEGFAWKVYEKIEKIKDMLPFGKGDNSSTIEEELENLESLIEDFEDEYFERVVKEIKNYDLYVTEKTNEGLCVTFDGFQAKDSEGKYEQFFWVLR